MVVALPLQSHCVMHAALCSDHTAQPVPIPVVEAHLLQKIRELANKHRDSLPMLSAPPLTHSHMPAALGRPKWPLFLSVKKHAQRCGAVKAVLGAM